MALPPQVDEFDILLCNTGAECGLASRQCHDHMPESRRIHVVDEVDDPVLKSADIETEDDVHHGESRLIQRAAPGSTDTAAAVIADA